MDKLFGVLLAVFLVIGSTWGADGWPKTYTAQYIATQGCDGRNPINTLGCLGWGSCRGISINAAGDITVAHCNP